MNLVNLAFKPFLTLFLLIAIGPVVAALFIHRQTGTINNNVFWGILAVGVITYAAIAYGLLNRKVFVDSNVLNIKSTFYSSSIDVSSITAVETVDAASASSVIGMRINGVALPGFRSGWFAKKNGGKIFVDTVGGDFLLISIGGSPAYAIQFENNADALRILKNHR